MLIVTEAESQQSEGVDGDEHEFHAVLEAVAQMTSCDIAQIEARHSSNREISMMRARGWWPSLKAIAAVFIARTVARMSSSSASSSNDDGASPASSSRKKKPRRGGGGAYRAFVSAMLRGTSGGVSAARLSEVAQQFRNLTESEKQFYEEVGEAATRAHAAGHEAFGAGGRGRGERRAPDALFDVPAAGDVRPDGVIVAADEALAFQQLQHYQGADTFGDRYLEQRRVVLADMKSQTKALAAKQEREQMVLAQAAGKSADDAFVGALASAGHEASAQACVSVGSGRCVPHLTSLQWRAPVASWVKAV